MGLCYTCLLCGITQKSLTFPLQQPSWKPAQGLTATPNLDLFNVSVGEGREREKKETRVWCCLSSQHGGPSLPARGILFQGREGL